MFFSWCAHISQSLSRCRPQKTNMMPASRKIQNIRMRLEVSFKGCEPTLMGSSSSSSTRFLEMTKPYVRTGSARVFIVRISLQMPEGLCRFHLLSGSCDGANNRDWRSYGSPIYTNCGTRSDRFYVGLLPGNTSERLLMRWLQGSQCCW